MSDYPPIAATFDDLVHRVPPSAWSKAAPCTGWVARDIIGHLVEWVPAVIGRSGIVFARMHADDDPASAWAELHRTLTDVLADPHLGERIFDAGPPGQMSVAQALDMLVVGDLFIHTWDLARATGLAAALDEGYATRMLDGLQPIDDLLRSSGHYGPKVVVPADASAADRLLAFTGRDPRWRA